MKECFLILISSGLDSTAAFLKLVYDNENPEAIFFPIYICWKKKSIDALKKEYENCEKLITHITEKYPQKTKNLKKLTKINIPLIFHEELKDLFDKSDKSGYWPYFRNGIFILSTVSYMLNLLKLEDYSQFNKISIAVGFIGNVTDEDMSFVKNMKKLLNEALMKPNIKKRSGVIEIAKEFDFYHPYLSDDEISYPIRPYFDIERYADSNILKYTWSCWKAYDNPCMKCGGCQTRKDKYERYKEEGGTLIDPYYE